MWVNIFKDINNFEQFQIESDNIRNILNIIELQKDKKYVDEIAKNNYRYILIDSSEINTPIYLTEEVILSTITGYDNLFIISEIVGEVKAALLIPYITAMAGGAGGLLSAGAVAVAANIAAAVINIAISIALNLVMNALSATKTFSSDPAHAQKKESSLFNGAPTIREQGGVMPLAYGNGFCGGVLISSSISTVEGDV